jgi:hypothetical protein
MGAFKTQHPARATRDALTTSQAMAVFDCHTQPDMLADVDTDRAVKRANPTLDTPVDFRHNLPFDQCFPATSVLFEQVIYSHICFKLYLYFGDWHRGWIIGVKSAYSFFGE